MKIKLIISTVLFISYSVVVSGQEKEYKLHYLGILPSVLAEPYDTLKAIEVNVVPLVYEFKLNQGLGLQVRPIANYRFNEISHGISQTGGTVLLNKYLLKVFREDFWLVPEFAFFYTFTYNQLDKIHTMTAGAEFGLFMKLKKNFSFSLNLQPGINYYPNQFSRDFVESESGFKSHFGVIFHLGYNFGNRK